MLWRCLLWVAGMFLMCSLSPCNPGCDVSAAPRVCFCLLTDLQPWIWVPVDVCCWLRTACYWKKKMMLQNQQYLSREPTSCITYPQHLEVLLDHLQAAGFTQHSEMASWVPIWFFLLLSELIWGTWRGTVGFECSMTDFSCAELAIRQQLWWICNAL